MIKRLFDVISSSIAIVFLLPLFGLIALLIKLDSRGPVFFIQKRIGRHFKPFPMFKFRSMFIDSPEQGPAITAGGGPGVTRVGRILRRTKLDELPQLFNVIRGEMSIVGPRPEVRKHVMKFRQDYREILSVRPGIMDMASLYYANEGEVLKDRVDPEEYYIKVLLPDKIELAKDYVRKSSLGYDLAIILKTVVKIFYPREKVLKLIYSLLPFRKTLVVGLQILIFALSSYLAFYTRFEMSMPGKAVQLFFAYLPILLLYRVLFMYAFALERGLWRYVNFNDIINISFSISLGSALFFVTVKYLFDVDEYPRSVIVFDWLFNIFGLTGMRLFRRFHEKRPDTTTGKKRVLVIGAGDAAEMLIREMEYSSAYPYKVVGLIDDDPRKKGLKIRGVPILGTRKEMEEIIGEVNVDEFLIAIPSATPTKLQSIVKALRQHSLPIKTLPGIWDILKGKDFLSNIRAVEPEDILFRPPAIGGLESVADFFRDKRILVTGAGGSIGSELCRQLSSFGPERLILYERHEENLYKIDMELRTAHSENPAFLVSVIGDILDSKRLAGIMADYRPDIVLHAAAYKHVPLMEHNPDEAFRNNVIGTKTIVEQAMSFGVERFVMISTDKAVNPCNVMGKTKQMAEEVCLSMADRHQSGHGTKVVIVRFGNVLGSSGSVVPLFKKQIDAGGPVTVTHPDIVRYFMTIPEAVTLVLQASSMGQGKDVFVLDMGKPVKILDMAKKLITLFGYRPGIDIEIRFSGLRPGEKMYEELFNEFETVEKTAHPKINRAVRKKDSPGQPLNVLDDLDMNDFFMQLKGDYSP